MSTPEPDKVALAYARHEVRTPLNHIIGYSEMLLEEVEDRGLGGDSAELLQRVLGNARWLVTRVGEVLSAEAAAARSEPLSSALAQLAGPVQTLINGIEDVRDAITFASATPLLSDVEKMAMAADRLREIVEEGVSAPGISADVTERAERAAPSTSVAAADYGAVLVVDDDPANCELLARRLTRQGYQVATAKSGSQAFELLRARAFDLVLLDVVMPEMTGDQVLQQLKSDEALHDIPVLMISALDELDSVVRCIELGADDYLPKPFDPVILRARVGACLEKKRLRNLERQHAKELAEWNRLLEQRVADQVAQMEKLGRLKRFFSPQLAELIVSGGAEDPLKTHRREITVVFLDLRGFTAFVESAEPEDLMAVLREFHGAMGELILAHEGTLERFTGDGMMIFFNDPVVVPTPAERAIRMAVAMRERVVQLATQWKKLGYELELGIGIAQGYATLGAIGFEGRWDYAALGSVTNMAARLCGEARGGDILVTRRVAALAETVVEAETLEPMTLKGFSRPVAAAKITRLK